jgi:UDP-glucose 4-epimerase
LKKILITGANSYIGTSVQLWLEKTPFNYKVDTLDMTNDKWKDVNFSDFDVVFHVAGIAHIKETKQNQELYYRVNRDLSFDIAKKAKSEGVKQFIFLSSMSVYGIDTGMINKLSPLNPSSAYGKSKLEAEKLIKQLHDKSFSIAILRPPMVYGKDCKGNYAKLRKITLKVPIFPDIENKRSMIYIDNLCEFVKQLIDNTRVGVFLPQNDDYVNTSEMVKLIAKAHNKGIIMTKLFNPFIRILKLSVVNKVFGSLVYDNSISDNINLITFEDSIKKCEE